MSDEELDPSKYTVYWFARDLVDSDQFGSYARKEPETIRSLILELEEQLEEEEPLSVLQETIKKRIRGSVKKLYGGDISKRYRQTEDLTERILHRIENREDVKEFIIAGDAVVRTTEIMDQTSRFGEAEINEIIDKTLKSDDGCLDSTQAFDALYLVDVDGEAYQLGAQRAPLIRYVSKLLEDLYDDSERGETAATRILSGIVQEYERRAGQSRASTAGNVLEIGLQRIFDRFEIPASGAPTHYDDLEVDNIVEGPDGTLGFSCKRTLRERYKQSLARQSEIGVDEIWFVSLLMGDVSREKLQIISNDGGRLYVPRDSFVWERYNDDDKVAYALRPADAFLSDIVAFTGCQLRPTEGLSTD